MYGRIYLDHAATTGVSKEVLDAMIPFFSGQYGNASSIHAFGREASRAVEKARRQVATAIGADADEIVFTGSGTESDNLAIAGLAEAAKGDRRHIITSKTEHHAVLRTCEKLMEKGFDVEYLSPDAGGRIAPEKVRDAIGDHTLLVSVMTANNETGTIQPIREIGMIAREHGVIFHTDAVQAIGSLNINVRDMNIDMLSMSAHKFRGPKGAGALFVRKGISLKPVLFGGKQERMLRPGTENVPAIVGMGKAIEIAIRDAQVKQKKITVLRDRLITGILSSVEGTSLNGDAQNRLPNNCNIRFDNVEGEALLLRLDLAGIACSGGSACTAGNIEPSHVLTAMGLTEEEANSSIRMTLGEDNTEAEIDETVRIVREIVQDLRKG